MRGLKGKGAIVAGGGGGIGRAIIGRLLAEGCKVACLDLNVARVEPVEGLVVLQADLTDETAVDRAVEAAVAGIGPIDLLVNATGVIGPTASIVDTSLDDFEAVFRANVRSPFLVTRAVMRRMTAQGGGAIVNIASTAAARGRAGRSLYGMSKRAVVGLTVTAALEGAGAGVRVNCVAPGPIEGEMFRGMVADMAGASGAGAIPDLSLGKPEDVADMVAFLLSDEARHCNGGTYVVDAGATV